MTPYQTILKFNPQISPDKAPMMSGEYAVSECDYELSKSTDSGGNITSPLRSGIIRMAIPQLPESILFTWMFYPQRQFDGTLVTYDLHQEVVEKISFTQARPIQLRFHYNSNGMHNATTLLTLWAKTMTIGDHELQNLQL